MKKADLVSIAHFIYETGILAKTPRSGLWFLGTGSQSVAEHTLRAIFITYALCHMTPKAKTSHAMMLTLHHDLGEGRTSDLNYVHQRYGRLAEDHAIEDLSKTVPFGKEISAYYLEAKAKHTLEAKLAKDADNLEWIATLREEEERGNRKARVWAKLALKRLKTPAGRTLGALLFAVHPDDWWFDERDKWFVDRKIKKSKSRKH